MNDIRTVRRGRSARASAEQTVQVQGEALIALGEALAGEPLGEAIDLAVDRIERCTGRLVVTGVGKSGIVARKIVATMNSTGTPAVFLHSAEAGHGDLGMVTATDIVLALSWSGESRELLSVVEHCRHRGVPLVVITAAAASTAADAADLVLLLPTVGEACPNRLAPTSSTTMQMVLGDALAVALVERRGFSSDDFIKLHPDGSLGSRRVTVNRLMGVGGAVPRVGLDATIVDAAMEMSRKRYGSTAVVDADDRIVGVFTDGDLRRSLFAQPPGAAVGDHMSRHPVTVLPETLAAEALALMNDNAITTLFVCRGDRALVGALHLHDLVRAGRG